MDSEPSPLSNSLCITHWENYRSQTLPIDSTDEPFFSGHAYPPRPDGFLQSIELQLKLLGNLRFTGTSRQKLLNLRHHAVNQHRRTACHAWCIKSPRSLLPIQLHRSLHADGCHAKSPDDIALLGITAFAELTGDHPKGCDIFLTMGKHRHVPVEIRYAAILFLKRQFAGDVGHAGRKHRQMKLGHGTSLPMRGKKKTELPSPAIIPESSRFGLVALTVTLLFLWAALT